MGRNNFRRELGGGQLRLAFVQSKVGEYISQKVLDSLRGPTLYKNARAITQTLRRDGEDQMLTSLFTRRHTARRPSGITMPCVVMCGSLGSSWVYNPAGKLGQEATNCIDNRRIRH